MDGDCGDNVATVFGDSGLEFQLVVVLSLPPSVPLSLSLSLVYKREDGGDPASNSRDLVRTLKCRGCRL